MTGRGGSAATIASRQTNAAAISIGTTFVDMITKYRSSTVLRVAVVDIYRDPTKLAS